MGNTQTTVTKKAKTSVLWGPDDYDTENCLSGCMFKCYEERIDLFHHKALRKTPFITHAVLLQTLMLHGDRERFPLLENRDVMSHIIWLFVEYSVQERIARCTKLAIPWKLERLQYRNDCTYISPPNTCEYMGKSQYGPPPTIVNRGRMYMVDGYFWYDDVYHSLVCDCPIRRDETKRRESRRITNPHMVNQRMGVLKIGLNEHGVHTNGR